jgi:eukaryotic-like serine/threonine-protein kinase
MNPGDGRLGGRYELGEIIGRGGMSTVYRSYDHRTGRDVAVKIFRARPEIADGDERIRREVTLLAGLRDPGIVTVFDAELDGPAPYLVTELVDGPTLSQQIRRAPLTEMQLIHLAGALARTLAYVHAQGIVHRDVKPSNILLSGCTEDLFTAPKLVDFGIAIAADATRLTATDLTLGTANYLSPEQLRSEPLTPATDIYSLGLVLIEALTGQPAYPGTGLDVTMARLAHPPVIPAVMGATLSITLTAMTAADPKDRPTAGEVERQLDGLESSRTTQFSPHGGADAPDHLLGRTSAHVAGRTHRPRRRSQTVAAASVVTAALAGVAAAAGFITHKPDSGHQTPPGYSAPTTSGSRAPTRAMTAGPRPPISASAPQQVANSVPSEPASTTPTRRSASTSHERPAPPKTSSAPTASSPTSPTSTSPSTPTASSAAGSPSTPVSSSDPGSPSSPPITSPPTSPTPNLEVLIALAFGTRPRGVG